MEGPGGRYPGRLTFIPKKRRGPRQPQNLCAPRLAQPWAPWAAGPPARLRPWAGRGEWAGPGTLGAPVSPTNDCVSACHSNLKSQSPLCSKGLGRQLWLSECPSIPWGSHSAASPWCQAQWEGEVQSEAPGPETTTTTSRRVTGERGVGPTPAPPPALPRRPARLVDTEKPEPVRQERCAWFPPAPASSAPPRKCSQRPAGIRTAGPSSSGRSASRGPGGQTPPCSSQTLPGTPPATSVSSKKRGAPEGRGEQLCNMPLGHQRQDCGEGPVAALSGWSIGPAGPLCVPLIPTLQLLKQTQRRETPLGTLGDAYTHVSHVNGSHKRARDQDSHLPANT